MGLGFLSSSLGCLPSVSSSVTCTGSRLQASTEKFPSRDILSSPLRVVVAVGFHSCSLEARKLTSVFLEFFPLWVLNFITHFSVSVDGIVSFFFFRLYICRLTFDC